MERVKFNLALHMILFALQSPDVPLVLSLCLRCSSPTHMCDLHHCHHPAPLPQCSHMSKSSINMLNKLCGWLLLFSFVFSLCGLVGTGLLFLLSTILSQSVRSPIPGMALLFFFSLLFPLYYFSILFQISAENIFSA